MKEELKKLAHAWWCTAHYSGKDKTMYIHGTYAERIVRIVTMYNPPFKVVAQ